MAQTKNDTVTIPKTWLYAGVIACVSIAAFAMLQGGENKFFASLIDQGGTKTVTIQTNKGDIEIELDYTEAPKTAENFYELARSGKYNNTVFHRVIKDFMIQGGDYENFDGTGGNAYKSKYIADEISETLSHVRGVISMANKGPNTNGSQFFIVQKDVDFLDGRHTIFGKVTSGMEVVDAIADVSTDSNDRPRQDITIRKVLVD